MACLTRIILALAVLLHAVFVVGLKPTTRKRARESTAKQSKGDCEGGSSAKLSTFAKAVRGISFQQTGSISSEIKHPNMKLVWRNGKVYLRKGNNTRPIPGIQILTSRVSKHIRIREVSSERAARVRVMTDGLIAAKRLEHKALNIGIQCRDRKGAQPERKGIGKGAEIKKSISDGPSCKRDAPVVMGSASSAFGVFLPRK